MLKSPRLAGVQSMQIRFRSGNDQRTVKQPRPASVYVSNRDAGSRGLTDLERPPGIRWLPWRNSAPLRCSPTAPHPEQFVPGTRRRWGRFPIPTGRRRRIPKHLASIIPHTGGHGKAVLPSRGSRRSTAPPKRPRPRVAPQAVADGVIRSTGHGLRVSGG